MAKLNESIALIAESAVENYNTYKIIPSLIAAQAYLETGNGKSPLAVVNNNYFGLKWYDTEVTRQYKYVTVPTKEERNGELITINDRFCTFESPIESLECLYRWYTIYTKYHVLQGVTDYRNAAQLVKECGYATDSKYPQKLINIIEREGFTRYDGMAISNIEAATSPHYIRVFAGSFTNHSNALNHLKNVRKYIPSAFLTPNNDMWRVQVGAFIDMTNADKLRLYLSKNNIDSFKEG